MAPLHKGLDFDYVEADPYRKSRWWPGISRNLAKVPVIVSHPGGTKLDHQLERKWKRFLLIPTKAKTTRLQRLAAY